MTSVGCSSGIDAVGPLEWGAHFCHLFHTRDDLVETVVPFFAAGLENNEQCLWVTSEPLEAEDATRELAKRVSGLQSKIERGQMRVVSHSDWYRRAGRFDADSLLGAWVAAEQSARAGGYAGVRAMGHLNSLKGREQWREFERYESRVSETFAGRRLIALCSYEVGTLEADDILDVLRHHQFAVVRREGEVEVLEKAQNNRRPGARGGMKRAQVPQPLLDPQLEQRVRERTEELEQALRKQEQAARAKDEFMAVLGHELRNPLAPMMTALQLMKLRGMASREQEILDRQLTHMTRLVDDLLDVARIARDKIELRKRPIELSQIVIQAIEVVSPLIEQRQQSLDVRVPREGLLVDADLERMAQVLGNLLTNASKYSDSRRRIFVTAAREGGMVRCSVKDEGIGIEAAMLDGIFDAFVQQPEAVDRSRGGLGLGLAIVRSLVVQHGGVVRAASDGLGHGSEFIVELPALERTGTREGIQPGTSAAPRSAELQAARRVLVVDDNVDAADRLKQALESLGYRVEIAHDGPSALSRVQSFSPDVALVDIGLPGIDGYEFARQLRSAGWDVGRLGLVALTGYGQREDRERSKAVGFAHHLVKPVDLGQLAAVLAEAAGQPAAETRLGVSSP